MPPGAVYVGDRGVPGSAGVGRRSSGPLVMVSRQNTKAVSPGL